MVVLEHEIVVVTSHLRKRLEVKYMLTSLYFKINKILYSSTKALIGLKTLWKNNYHVTGLLHRLCYAF
jgi:hypothetical protein